MKTEKIIFSFIGTLIGLLAAAGGFYFYQQSVQKTPEKKTELSKNIPTPTPTIQVDQAITIFEPKDEAISSKKSITIKGKTFPNAVVVISTNIDDDTTTADTEGQFTMSWSLSADENIFHITTIAPEGQEATKTMTVSYITEDF